MNLTLNTVEHLRQFIPEMTVEKTFESVQPRLELVEQYELLPLLGEKTLQMFRAMALVTPLDKSGSPSGSSSQEAFQIIKEKALHLLQQAAAFFTAFDIAKTGDVFLTSSGIQTVSSTTHKSAFQYQKRDLMVDYAHKADAALDALLLFMEENKGVFSDWSTDPLLYTQQKELFISSAQEFSQAVNINRSRRTYLALRPFILENEILFVIPTLGKELAKILKENNQEDQQTQKIHQELLNTLIRPAVANLAMADALDALSLRFTGDFVSFSSFLGMDENTRKSFADQKQERRRFHAARGNAFLKQSVDFVLANIDHFETFTQPEKPNTGMIDLEYPDDNSKNFYLGF